jgi:hypothetical protein
MSLCPTLSQLWGEGYWWSLGWVQALPLGCSDPDCARYVHMGRACPAGVVNSFPLPGPHLWHLSLCHLKQETACCFLCWTQPPTGQWPVPSKTCLSLALPSRFPYLHGPLMCKNRICRESSISLVSLFCPLSPPLSSTWMIPRPPPHLSSVLQMWVREPCQKVGSRHCSMESQGSKRTPGVNCALY